MPVRAAMSRMVAGRPSEGGRLAVSAFKMATNLPHAVGLRNRAALCAAASFDRRTVLTRRGASSMLPPERAFRLQLASWLA
jgi:hypothetical protein